MPALPHAPRPAVLVVEDEPRLRHLLTRYCQAIGVDSFAAGDAAEAARLLRAHAGQIGAALIDLRMPGGDGLEVRRRLDGVKPGLPCCLMSGLVGEGDAAPDGFRRALGKPFRLAELQSCLDDLFQA
jgi:CheY-like chemotaxis protein